MFRLRGLRRSPVTARSKVRDNGIAATYPASGLGSSQQGNAAGVIIDGALYTLDGEPPTAKPGNWWRKIN